MNMRVIAILLALGVVGVLLFSPKKHDGGATAVTGPAASTKKEIGRAHV